MTEKSGGAGAIRAALMPIGRELLTGRVLDTNSQYLASNLFDVGILVDRTCAVDDSMDAIAKELRRCRRDGASVIVTCGGLGPTPDDMTLRAVAAGMRRDYLEHGEAMAHVTRRYRDLFDEGRIASAEMTPDRAKMGWMPSGAKIMPNAVGTAPGAILRWGGARVFCLPGVPAEMKAMAETNVFPELAGLSNSVVRRKTVELGTGDESSIAAIIRRLQPDHPQVHIKPNPKRFGGRRVMYVHLESEGDPNEVEARLEACAHDLRSAWE